MIFCGSTDSKVCAPDNVRHQGILKRGDQNIDLRSPSVTILEAVKMPVLGTIPVISVKGNERFRCETMQGRFRDGEFQRRLRWLEVEMESSCVVTYEKAHSIFNVSLPNQFYTPSC